MQLHVTRAGFYLQDYGGPIGNRILGRHPEWLQWLIIQNGNTYEEGFTGVWDALRGALWKNRTAETEAPLLGFMEPAGVGRSISPGRPDPARISPDAWNSDLFYLGRPGARRANLDLLYDYRKNVPLYPTWQKFLRDHRPPTLIVWGKGDIFFTQAGASAYLRDVPEAELHFLDGGHFVLEDHAVGGRRTDEAVLPGPGSRSSSVGAGGRSHSPESGRQSLRHPGLVTSRGSKWFSCSTILPACVDDEPVRDPQDGARIAWCRCPPRVMTPVRSSLK